MKILLLKEINMKIGGEVFPAFNPYSKSTYEIHISGCTRHCKGCHNYDLQDFNFGEELNLNKYIEKLKKRAKFYDAIAVLGGDLLCQDFFEAKTFAVTLRTAFPKKELWLFTGEEIHSVPKWAKAIFDYIKVGPYMEKFWQEGFPASSNQKLLKKGVDYARNQESK